MAGEDKTTAMPGPWEVVWLRGDALGRPSEVCVAGTDNRVAFLASDGSLGTARLIAAAPDMLAALKAAEGHLEEMRKDRKWHPIEHCPVLDQVRRAIETAEGCSGVTRNQTTGGLEGWTDDELAEIHSARDQIAKNRRCERLCSSEPYVCGCLTAAARRIGREIMEREEANG